MMYNINCELPYDIIDDIQCKTKGKDRYIFALCSPICFNLKKTTPENVLRYMHEYQMEHTWVCEMNSTPSNYLRLIYTIKHYFGSGMFLSLIHI